jgi:hypothetical protein
MKCKYRFKVNGRIRPTETFPIPVGSWIFEFEVGDALISHITVTVRVNQREFWPMISQNQSPERRATIRIRTPHLVFIQRTLQSLQGLLSLFGLSSIELNTPHIEWLPENEEEKQLLKLHSYKMGWTPLPDRAIQRIPFDLLARSVLAADAAMDIEVILNFFRRGMVDMYNQNYIEAIYDFYFIFETLFGEGKFKKASVRAAFQRSDQLRFSVTEVVNNPSSWMHMRDAELKTKFEETYGKMTVDQAIDKIIDLWGYLHHHTLKRNQMWHPDKQSPFLLDALFLEAVAFNVCFKMADKYLSDNSVVQKYSRIANTRRDGGITESCGWTDRESGVSLRF